MLTSWWRAFPGPWGRRGAFTVVAGAALLLADPSPATAQAAAQQDWVVPARRAQRPNPIQADAQVVARGRELYLRECETCHGRSGHGDGRKARELETRVRDLAEPETQQQSDGALFYKITEGRGDMPNNKTNLTEEERWMVVHYLRTFAAKKS